MYRKAEWFRPKSIGWGLTPITWQGWVWTLGWSAALSFCAIGATFGYLLGGLLAFFVLLAYLIYDVSVILKEIQESQANSN